MPSCAGAYVFGDEGSNECPAGSVRIETEAACRTAATAAGKTPSSYFVETDPDYPRGCYASTNYAYFNIDAVGAGQFSSRLLCAALAATTGAPSRALHGSVGLTGVRLCRIVRDSTSGTHGAFGTALCIGRPWGAHGIRRGSRAARRSVVRFREV